MQFKFEQSTLEQAKLRFTFDGPAGSGKTFSSLMLAAELGGQTGLIDSEHKSSKKYAKRFNFKALYLEDYSIDAYRAAIKAARDQGIEILIIDSLSHAWSGKGGALEEVDRSGKDKFTSGWRNVTPKHNQLIDDILAYPGHVICTMRKKQDYVIEEINGKKVPRKIGLAPVQREGMEYEFDIVVDLDVDGSLTISKTRCSALTPKRNQFRHEDVPEIGRILRTWLNDGETPAPAPAAAAPAQPPGSSPAPVQQSATPSLSLVKPPDSSERARLSLGISEATTQDQLNALAKEIAKLREQKQLSDPDYQAVRAQWGVRRDSLKKGSAA